MKKNGLFLFKTLAGVAIITGLTLGVSLPAVATGSDIETSFYALKQAIRSDDTPSIQSLVTQSSLPTVNRLNTYHLNACLPNDLAYAGERYEGDYVYVTVETPYAQGQVLTSELAFLYENNKWKLDVPESFRNGIGKDWQSTLNQIESLYVALKGQFGDVVNCTMVQELVKNSAK